MFSRIISAVHPRMRGERHLVTRMDPCQDGSSPHVRGTPTAPEAETLRSRFIPACAGNAHPLRACIRCQSVHPRIRGERAGPGSDRTKPVGSSPHARGTRQGLTREPGRHRFILACAGNACAGRPRLPQSAVHPRMCGECLPAASTTSILIGSSPHVRGTPPGYRLPAAQRRSIPACAGNALDGISRKAVNTVHPRMRGEHRTYSFTTRVTTGSSPHVRGTLLQDRERLPPERFIPACAGNARREQG